ncbi:programmed cell death protein 7 [Pimephales promelas]|uniref:programmed cell death protein 7 n=1 Tax=Pimephales promelas TaxID=90988 RepID=UPI0019555547|nr:programmed cell death protein 7 [Pimephales promelas]KAG1959533.1 programmed cell death protein [Pimephales promelas]
MDNSQQFGYMGAPPPAIYAPPSTYGAGFAGGGAGPPPMPPPAAAGHTWDMYQHPPVQTHWPHFPPFDPSRPPPVTFEPPQHTENPPTWLQNQWNQPEHHHSGQFPPNQHQYPNSAPPSYQSNVMPDHSAHMYTSNRQNYPFTDQSANRPWLDDSQNNSKMTSVTACDEESKQLSRDQQWIQRFLRSRLRKPSETKRTESHPPLSQFKEKLYGTVKMLSELNIVCQMLKDNLENEDVWTSTLSKAAELKNHIQERLAELKDPDCVRSIQRKVLQINKKRARMRRRKVELKEEELQREARRAEREAVVDKWQAKRIQEVEEKNREKEMKKAADAVLSEVRKKQADAKRMLDILKSLEKLRKLRKEAAARKGMFPGKPSDDIFDGHLERLRSLIRKRTAIYATEEKALRVMLEGEQEEERKRDREKRLKKEKEKLLQKKRDVDAILFGADLPPDHPLQPFHDYYTQAERSLPALIQIRREWDQFLVSVEHPDGTSVPQGWVLPEPPADDIWATALEK